MVYTMVYCYEMFETYILLLVKLGVDIISSV